MEEMMEKVREEKEKAINRLRRFFAEKGHKNLVLRLVEVLQLPREYQETVSDLVRETFHLTPLRDDYKQFFSRVARGEYLIFPMESLLSERTTLARVEAIQALCYAYADARIARGFPCRDESCPSCRGAGGDCKACGGTGRSYTFLEITPEEQGLAAGVQ